MKDAYKRYTRNLLITMVFYVAAIFASQMIYHQLPEHPARTLILLLPVIPVLFMLRVYMELVRSIDEMQQRIQMEALAFSLGVTGILTFTYGFLEGAGWPKIGMIWVFPLSIALWGIGLAIATRRYQ